MNKHLQSILNILQQDETLSTEQKKDILKSLKDADKELDIITFKLDRTEKVKKTTAILLEETIEELEQKRKAVEAQNKELEIETSLERVRTVAMGMRKADDLLDVCQALFAELRTLGFDELRNAMINIFNNDSISFLNYDYSDNAGKTITSHYHNSHPVIKKQVNEVKSSRDAFSETVFSGKDLDEWRKFRKEKGEKDDPKLDTITALFYYFYAIGTGAIGISTYSSIPNEKLNVLKRFRNVFDLAYRRFIDIENAEAQAREAQIEASLERVRSKTMAMHSSDDVGDTVAAMFNEFVRLGIQTNRCGISIFSDETSPEVWTAKSNPEGKANLIIGKLDLTVHALLHEIHKAWKKKETFYTYTMEGNDLRNYYQALNDLEYYPVKFDMSALPLKEFHSSFYFPEGSVFAFTSQLIPEEHTKIIKRFAGVFGQTYRRYLDLQKAEAQVREAQIQLALERVRSRAMAMYHSEELNEVLSVLIEQFDVLGIQPVKAVLSLFDETKKTFTFRTTGRAGQRIIGEQVFDINANDGFKQVFETWKKSKPNSVLCFHISKDILPEVWAQFPNTFTNMPEEAWVYPADYPDGLYNTFGYCKFGFIGFDHTRPATKEEEDITIRFANEFERLYQRFLDLQKAEAQAREGQIQLAMERVRAKTMAMQHSNQLQETALLLLQQVLALGVSQLGCGFNIWDEDRKAFTSWMGGGLGENTLVPPFKVSTSEDVFLLIYEAAQRGESLFVKEQAGEELETHYRYMFSMPVWKGLMDDFTPPTFQVMHCAFFSQGFLMFISTEPIPEAHDIFIRFAKVFEQTYTRFLDLQKSEAQARESQIQLSLERVRARTMAMQHSNELPEAAQLLFQQVQSLGMPAWSAGYCIWDEDKKAITLSMSRPWGDIQPSFRVPLDEDPSFIHFLEAHNKGEELFIEEISGNALAQNYKYLRTLPVVGEQLDAIIKEGNSLPTYQVNHCAYFSKGFLLFITYEQVPESHKIFKRFANVFDQTYTRFLDLQKAEAQARESQIELGLERVRAKAMAMQNSEELNALIGTVFTELTKLDLVLTRCVIIIYDTKTNGGRWWMANSEAPSEPMNFLVKHSEHPPSVAYLKAWQQRTLKWEYPLQGAIKKEWDDFLFSETELSQLPDFVISGMKAPDKVYLNASFNNFGNLTLASLEPLSEEHFGIMLRFAKVFDLTYTRFNDLQRAEAQARESQIQLGLERVRARTMAMQNSNELADIVDTVFKELTKLHFALDRCIIMIYDPKTLGSTWWLANPEPGSVSVGSFVKYHEHKPYLDCIDAWKNRVLKWQYLLEGDSKKEWDEFIFNETDLSLLPEFVIKGMRSFEQIFLNVSFNNFGSITVSTVEPLQEEHFDILLRFAKVFDSTYTRFNDLKQAEAQARESQIQLGLERVRARTMAMQHSYELKEAAALLFQQAKVLGVPAYSCGYNIWEKDDKVFTSWMSTQDGSIINGVPDIPLTEDANFMRYVESKEKGEPVFVLELRGERMQEHYQYLKTIPAFKGYFDYAVSVGFDLPKTQIHYLANFSHGNLLFISMEPCPEFHDVFKRFAAVFEQTYTRFLDLQKAEAQAREAGIQLALERVRARTMAMQKQNDLLGVLDLLVEQLVKLGVNLQVANFSNGIPGGDWDLWIEVAADDGTIFNNYVHFPRIEHPYFHQVEKNIETYRKDGTNLFKDVFSKDEKDSWQDYINTQTIYKDLTPEDIRQSMYEKPGYIWSMVILKDSWVSICRFNTIPFSDEEDALLRRFANAFGQTYTRFLDLQNAEAQAREAQIEAALERVRSRSMGMQKSEELRDVIQVVFEQLLQLNFKADSASFGLDYKSTDDLYLWSASRRQTYPILLHIPYIDIPIFNQVKEAKEKGLDFVSASYSFEEKNAFWQHLFSHAPIIPKDRQQYLLSTPGYSNSVAMMDSVSLFIINYHGDSFSDAENAILKRFAKVFEQTYTRFLDLQKAEAQAKEAKIEAALERVRSRSVAMRKSEEIADIAGKIFSELKQLDLALNRVLIWTFNDIEKYTTWWSSNPEVESTAESYRIDYNENPAFINYLQAWQQRKPIHLYFLAGDIKKSWSDFLFEHTELSRLPAAVIKNMREEGDIFTISVISDYGLMMAGSLVPLSDANIDIIQRFGRVFQQSYTRYLDVQKAEAQAREAQIETVLEKIRSTSLAMHHSDELEKVVEVLSHKLSELGLSFDGAMIYVFDREKRNMLLRVVSQIVPVPVKVNLPYDYEIEKNEIFKDFWRAIENGSDLINKSYSGKTKNDYFRYVGKYNDPRTIPDTIKNLQLEADSWIVSYTAEKNSVIGFDSWSGQTTSEQDFQVLKRIARVFEQAYTRFLDLQRAEAQTREARIENALEKVRSRTMAMQHSDELADVAQLLFQQVKDLGITAWTTGFNIWQPDNAAYIDWITGPTGNFLEPYRVDLTTHAVFAAIREARQRGDDFFVSSIEGEQIKETYQLLSRFGDKGQFQKILDSGIQFPTHQYNHFVFGAQVSLMFITYDPYPEAHDIFKRFGKVFEQTYTRFLDLQKAEAQARESQIEAALERVRSRSMGMQKSEELRDVIQVIFEQLIHLNFNIDGAGFGVDFRESDDWNLWVADRYLPYPNKISIPYFDHPYSNAIIEAKHNGVELLVYSLTFEEKNKMWDHVFKYAPAPQEAKESVYSSPGFAVTDVLMKNVELFMENYAGIPYTDAENATLIRFGKVFEQTYTRFNDLKNAEVQALEAIKRASVDRVRAEIASMRTTNDLERITPLIWNELTTLGVPFIRCGVFIMDEEKQQVQTFLYTEGKTIASFTSTFSNSTLIIEALPYWRRKEIYKTHWDEAAFLEQARNLVEQGSITSGEKYLTEHRPTDLYLHFLPFLQGMLYVGDAASLSNEHLQLVQALAEAFSTAYARYEDFNKLESAKKQVDSTLTELQATQKQLIQSEKMASLGELTAGIAHEIQNPLNFVNNFSEVSRELIEELKSQKEKLKPEEQEELLKDIDANLEKINHHGKRADAIVKGMLQHSRSTGNEKQPTDINALADEYLRLAYHGLRAKDKSFNATLVTDYDEAIGKINVIPQDIGRVILNVITNAFYTVNEKKKVQGNSYEPTVSIITKKNDDSIEIKVVDNGNGIPQKVVDKIFQPFFTTKPTGQGTGLGLSLAYDIVKTHDGELKVETKEGEGSGFIIQLPIKEVK